MGDGMVRRLSSVGHACVVYDKQPAAVDRLVKQGAMGAASLREMVARLGRPRVFWQMVPAAGVDLLSSEPVPLLAVKADPATGDPDLGRYADWVSDCSEGRGMKERGPWGPREADVLTANVGGWHSPVPEKVCA